MKISNLILTFILALVASLTLHSQSNTVREISIEEDDKSIYIKYVEGEVLKLKIDGKLIDKNDYDNYQTILVKYEDNASVDPDVKIQNHNEHGLQAKLHHSLKSYLIEKSKMKNETYEFKLTSKYIKVNGKKQGSETHQVCLDIFKEILGNALSRGSYFHVDITPNSRSISLSIED